MLSHPSIVPRKSSIFLLPAILLTSGVVAKSSWQEDKEPVLSATCFVDISALDTHSRYTKTPGTRSSRRGVTSLDQLSQLGAARSQMCPPSVVDLFFKAWYEPLAAATFHTLEVDHLRLPDFQQSRSPTAVSTAFSPDQSHHGPTWEPSRTSLTQGFLFCAKGSSHFFWWWWRKFLENTCISWHVWWKSQQSMIKKGSKSWFGNENEIRAEFVLLLGHKKTLALVLILTSDQRFRILSTCVFCLCSCWHGNQACFFSFGPHEICDFCCWEWESIVFFLISAWGVCPLRPHLRGPALFTCLAHQPNCSPPVFPDASCPLLVLVPAIPEPVPEGAPDATPNSHIVSVHDRAAAPDGKKRVFYMFCLPLCQMRCCDRATTQHRTLHSKHHTPDTTHCTPDTTHITQHTTHTTNCTPHTTHITQHTQHTCDCLNCWGNVVFTHCSEGQSEKIRTAKVNGSNCDTQKKRSDMPRHLIGDAQGRSTENSYSPYLPAKPQPWGRACDNQRGQKTLLILRRAGLVALSLANAAHLPRGNAHVFRRTDIPCGPKKGAYLLDSHSQCEQKLWKHGVLISTACFNLKNQCEHKLGESTAILCGRWRVGEMEVTSGKWCPRAALPSLFPKVWHLFVRHKHRVWRFSHLPGHTSKNTFANTPEGHRSGRASENWGRQHSRETVAVTPEKWRDTSAVTQKNFGGLTEQISGHTQKLSSHNQKPVATPSTISGHTAKSGGHNKAT